MKNNTARYKDKAIDFKKPGFDDPITDTLRRKTRQLLTAAGEAEIDFLQQFIEFSSPFSSVGN
ncbi:MAG: hypothetical protein HY892_08605 [Deltaproteobacteria bacterium]|nr:hypothetical protein [Deltaproteobacteria bacterium]